MQTYAFGKNAYIVDKTTQNAFFHPEMNKIDYVKIVTAAVAYDHPTTFVTYILMFPQSLYIPRMNHHLLCPDQLRDFGVTVNDIPLLRMQPTERTSQHHSIIDYNSGVHIPLHYYKPISYFTCRKPTHKEIMDTVTHLHVHMTSSCNWIPHDEQTRICEALLGKKIMDGQNLCMIDNTVIDRRLDSLSRILLSLGQNSLLVALRDRAGCSIYAVKTAQRKGTVTPEEIAQSWR